MLRIVRPQNLALLGLIQCFVLARTGDYNFLFYDIHKTLALLASTSLIAAAGYIINDYFDLKIDLINKPHRVFIGQNLPRRWAMTLHLVLTIIGLTLAWQVNLLTFGISFLCSILLYLYSATLKRKFLIGNLAIAILAALSVYICQAGVGLLNINLVLSYSFFAGFTTFLREIVKDIEDEEGDAIFHSHSLAIEYGLQKTKKVLTLSTSLLFLILILYVIWQLENTESTNLLFNTYIILLLAGVGLPLLVFMVKLRNAKQQDEFAQLSRLLKVIMLIGVFSILFC